MKINDKAQTCQILKERKLLLIFSIIFIISAVFFFVGFLSETEHIEASIIFLIGAIGCTIGAVYIIKMIKLLNKEIKKRTVSNDDEIKAKEGVKYILIICAIIITISTVIIFLVVSGNTGNNGTSNNSSKCRNCGRKTDLVSGFGYCYDCYEGFNEWQKDYYKKN